MKNYSEMSDKELVVVTASSKAAVSERSAAFEHIVNRHCRQLTQFVSMRARNFHDTQDCVQETFLRAYSNIEKFDCNYSLRNWLFTIAYRIVIGNYRKKRPVQLSGEAEGQLEANAEVEDGYEWLWHAVRAIGDDAFMVMWLRYKQDMKTEEIASIMDKSENYVRVLLSRSRKKLKEKIEKYDINFRAASSESKCIKPGKITVERAD